MKKLLCYTLALHIALFSIACSLDDNSSILKAVEVTAAPSEPSTLGDPVNLRGMVVTGIYSNKSRKTLAVSRKDITGYDANKLGLQTLTLTWQGLSATFTVTVEPVTLRVFNVPWVGDAEEIATIWDAFSESHPGIIIEREDVDPSAYQGAIDAYFQGTTQGGTQADSLPDLFFAWIGGPSQSLHQDYRLKDLSSLLETDNLFSAFYKVLDAEVQYGGFRGVIPLGFQVKNLLYTNRQVLENCLFSPATELDRLGTQAATLRANGYEVLAVSDDADLGEVALFSLIAGRLNRSSWGKKLFTGEAAFTDPLFIAVLDTIKSLYRQDILAQSSFVQTADGDAAFIRNEYAYYLGSTGEAIAAAPGMQSLVTVSAFFPLGEGLNNSITVSLAPGWGMSRRIEAGTGKEAAAWELIKWLTGREVQTWLLAKGYIECPSRNDVLPEPINLIPESSYSLSDPYLKSILNGKDILVEPYLEDDLQQAIAQVVRELDPLTADLAPEEGAARIQAAFAK